MDTTCLGNGQRQTTKLNYKKSTMWETKPRIIPQTTYQLLMGPEQVTKPKTLQAMLLMMYMIIL